MATDRILDARGVAVAFGKAEVLAGVDVHVDKGETVAVVGPNGAGKTTLLRALSRLVRSTGDIAFGGAPLPEHAPAVARAGLLHCPERRRVFPGLSVRDNLEMGAHRFGRDRSRRDDDYERVYTLFPRLQERGHQAAGTLSGGEQQQLAIGRCLMGRPTLMLLDEPSLGLSAGVKEAIASSVESMHQAGVTMLLVEQDVTFAFRCADRVLVLEHGTVARDGPTAVISADPYVRQVYLGVA
jgi:branched-chain amino acid transport system ATP-binding protein